MFENRRITSESIGWKIPLNLAILFHILVISSAIIVPKFLEKKIIIPEFLTVDLVTVAAPLPPPVAEPAKQRPASLVKTAKPAASKPKPKIVKAKITAPIAPVIAETPVPVPVKAISIKPIKRKIKKKILPDTTAADARRERKAEQQRQLLEKQRQRLLHEAQRAKALAEAEEAAAKDAVNALKQLYRADSAAISTSRVIKPSNNRTGGNPSNIIERQYQAAINNQLNEHWSSPITNALNSDLSARVVITIAKNGNIIDVQFENRSGDRVFDQFVNRAIQESNPLPPIPPAMHVQQYHIGSRFRPGKIQ